MRMPKTEKMRINLPIQYQAMLLMGAVGKAHSAGALASGPRGISSVNIYLPVLFSLPFIFLLLGAVIYSIIRLRKIKAKKKKDQRSLELTREEAEALFKQEEFAADVKGLERMSREELRIMAEKELQKQGLKPGEKNFLKGPLDWDDVDENFRPRPKIIRSDFSKMDIPKKTEEEKKKNSPDEKDKKSSSE